MVQQPAIRKGKAKGKGPELVFDEKARAEYLSGFRKRKQERKQAGREYLAKKIKEEQLATRRDLRNARKEKAAENVRNERKAFGLEAEGESDADATEDDHDEHDDQVPQIQDAEYDSDQHRTQVVIEEFDPEQEAFHHLEAKAIASKPASSNSKKESSNGQGQEEDRPHSKEDLPIKRLHVSGLTEAFTKVDLIQRFSAFGTVKALDGLGKRDALGQLRPYAYISLQATEQQIKRCMNVLSGSMWKGSKLRVGEAKPDYAERVQLEQEKSKRDQDQASLANKRKRLPPGMGVESSRMQPITGHDLENGLAWGWKRTPAGHLIRPLKLRPSHPIPKPKSLSSLEDADRQRESAKSSRTRINPRPPSKAHRITIDPTRYGAVHLTGDLLENLASTQTGLAALDLDSLGPGEWQCQEIAGEDSDHQNVEADTQTAHRLVRWQFVARDGSILHEEFTKLPVRLVSRAPLPTEEQGREIADEYLDFDQYSEASDDLFSGLAVTASAKESSQTGPGDDNDGDDDDDLFSGFNSKASTSQSALNAANDVQDDLFSDVPMPIKNSSSSSNTLNVSTSTDATNGSSAIAFGTFVPGLDPDEEDPANFSDGYDEGRSASLRPAALTAEEAAAERTKTLAILGQMFGSEVRVEGGTVDARGEATHAQDASLSSEMEAESSISPSPGSSSTSESEVASETGSDSDSDSEPDSSSDSCSDENSEDSTSESGRNDKLDRVDDTQAVQVDDKVVANATDEASYQATPQVGPTTNLGQEAATESLAPSAAAPSTNAKTRREAFLLALTDSTGASSADGRRNVGSFKPITRFDPGTNSHTHANGIESSHQSQEATDDLPSTSSSSSSTAGMPKVTASGPVLPSASSAAAATNNSVSMSSLKDMFRPQDVSAKSSGFSLGLAANSEAASGGFSLMDSLGLELELEDQDEDPFGMNDELAPDHQQLGPGQVVGSEGIASITSGRLDSGGRMPANNRAFFLTLDNLGSIAVEEFMRPPTPEEKAQAWKRNKEILTSQIKKRHREAVKKRRRRFGGGFGANPNGKRVT